MDFKLKRFKKSIEVSRIANIHYFEFTKQYYTAMDSHEFRELIYVDTGSVYIEAEDFNGTLERNMMIVHKSGEYHSLSCPKGDAPNVIIIGFECKSGELDKLSKLPLILNAEQQKLLTDVVREGRLVFQDPYDIPNLKDMKKRKEYPFGADQMIKLKLETLFIDLIRSMDTVSDDVHISLNDSKIQEIHSYIERNYKEKITLDELCFLFGTNKTSLCNDFKAAYSDTVIGYINKLRIKQAKKLMREGNYNLTEIASMLKFSSIHYFSRMFKKHENISPTEYINTVKSHLDINS